MSPEPLRQALRELNGERDLEIVFAEVFAGAAGPGALLVRRAILIPDEADHLVKVTDGKSVFVLDAARVAWLRIGLA